MLVLLGMADGAPHTAIPEVENTIFTQKSNYRQTDETWACGSHFLTKWMKSVTSFFLIFLKILLIY